MRLTETKATFSKAPAAPDSAEPLTDLPAEESRALVPVTPVTADGRDRSSHYRSAPFLAHLIATKDQHPQTRERRRVEPRDAVAAYRSIAALIQ
jgi:hypothetical protein